MCVQSLGVPFQAACGFVESCATKVSQKYTECTQEVESARKRFVAASYDRCPEGLAKIVERVSMAVPETFAALASLVGGIVTLPALLISWGRKIYPFLPLIQNVLQGKVSKDDLGDGCKKMLDGLNDVYENTLIPALFVALTVDTIFSFAMGWIFWDFERMLHASTIAFPGAFLTAQHMWATTERGYSLRT